MREHLEDLDGARALLARSPVREPAGSGALHASPGAARRGAPLSTASVLRLQRSIGNAGTAAVLQREEEGEGSAGERSPVHATIESPGSPLDTGTRSFMEHRLGADFSDVRLHVDRHSAESVKAAAYTVGNNVVVHPDHYAPGTPQTQRTLAHELTHVKQQRSGPVDGSPAPGGIQLSHPSDRFEQEAERSASEVMSSVSTQRMPAEASGTGEEPSIQRLTVQREGEEESEDESED